MFPIRTKRPAAAAAAFAFCLLAGAAGAGCRGTQPRDALLDADAVGAAIRAKFANDERLARRANVKVDPSRGAVTLSGQVATPEDRAAAGKIASTVPGVTVIYNDLVTEHPARHRGSAE